MKAFVGELSSFDWFDWACKAKLCNPDDEVTRCVLDVGIDNMVTVYIGKHVDAEKADLRFPVLANVRDVAKELKEASGEIMRLGKLVHKLDRELEDRGSRAQLSQVLQQAQRIHGCDGLCPFCRCSGRAIEDHEDGCLIALLEVQDYGKGSEDGDADEERTTETAANAEG